MEEIKCSCGGMFQYLGPEFLRTGNIQFLVDKDVEEKCIPGELYVCDRCRCLRFCANAIWISERKAWWEEQRAEVERPASVRIKYLDYNGEPQEILAEDFLAVAAQHEIDHLDGILYIDRISRLKRQMLLKKLEKARKESGK